MLSLLTPFYTLREALVYDNSFMFIMHRKVQIMPQANHAAPPQIMHRKVQIIQ